MKIYTSPTTTCLFDLTIEHVKREAIVISTQTKIMSLILHIAGTVGNAIKIVQVTSGKRWPGKKYNKIFITRSQQ